MAIIKRTKDKCWQGCREIGTLVHFLLVGTQNGVAAMKKSLKISQEIKNRTTTYPPIPLLSIYPKKRNGNLDLEEILVHCSFIYNSQDVETPKCLSMDEWIKKMWYAYNRISFSLKKDGNPAT